MATAEEQAGEESRQAQEGNTDGSPMENLSAVYSTEHPSSTRLWFGA